MAEIVWTGPAQRGLNEIAEYIALDNPAAASRLVARIERYVLQLEFHPQSGSFISEMPDSSARQLIEPPCRILYQVSGERVYILHVLRFEQLFRPSMLEREDD